MNLHVPAGVDADALLAEPNLRLRVGEHVVDVGALKVVTRPELPRLTSKAVAVLLELVRNAGDTVTRDRLLDAVWKGRCPTPDVLTQAVKELRRAFADDAKPSRYIETVPKVGYRLIAPVFVLDAAGLGGTFDALVPEPAVADAGAARELAVEAGADRAPAAMPVRHARGRAAAAAVALAVIAVLVLVGVAFRFARERTAATERAWRATDLHSITSDPGGEYRPHLSPDGTRVAYSHANPSTGLQRVVVRAVEPSREIDIGDSPTEHSSAPVWSPDGSRIAFQRFTPDRCAIFVVPSLGGNEREVGPCENYIFNYFDWTPDGSGLVTAGRVDEGGEVALLTWDLSSGAKTPLRYAHTPRDQDLEARYSPDGRWLAFRRGLAPYSDLMVMPASGGDVRPLTRLATRIRGYTWTADSSALVFSAGHSGRFELYAVDLAGGEPQRLDVGPAEYPDAARSGDLVVYEIPRTLSALAEFPLGTADVAGARFLAASTGNDGQPALSADGRQLAFVSDRSGSQQLWVHDLANDTTLPVTEFAGAIALSPSWRPDGKALLAVARNADASHLVEIDLASRRQRVVGAPAERVLYGIYGPDPDSFLMLVGKSGMSDELVAVRDAGRPGERRDVLASGVEHVDVDRASRTVYYTKTALRGLFRRGFDGGPEQFVTSAINSIMMDAWSVVDGAIWYVRGLSIAPGELRRFDPASGSDTELGRLSAELRDARFAVTPAHDRVIVSKVRTEDIDVGAFTLRRSVRD